MTAGTGQLERTVGTRTPWQDSHGRKKTTGQPEITGKNRWGRTPETRQLWQDSQPGQDIWDRTAGDEQPRQISLDWLA
jgi:hypothetical protein